MTVAHVPVMSLEALGFLSLERGGTFVAEHGQRTVDRGRDVAPQHLRGHVEHLGQRPQWTVDERGGAAAIPVVHGERGSKRRRLRLDVIQWLRGQERFESSQALAAQIAKDVEAVKRMAAGAVGPQGACG